MADDLHAISSEASPTAPVPTHRRHKSVLSRRATLVADFAYDGGGMGKGATVTLSANGTTIGEGRVDATVPVVYGTDGFDIGGDYGSPVSPEYQAPFIFTGTLERVTIDLR